MNRFHFVTGDFMPRNHLTAAAARGHRAGFSFAALACFIAAFLLLQGHVFGQSTFASLLGSVRDASGAAVSNCVISVENSGTARTS